MGERMGMHSKKQAEINEILVDAGAGPAWWYG